MRKEDSPGLSMVDMVSLLFTSQRGMKKDGVG